jgi:hypothetical protein
MLVKPLGMEVEWDLRVIRVRVKKERNKEKAKKKFINLITFY